MSINQFIINYQDFLIRCWPNILKILGHIDWDDSPYFLESWMQANWELIVEKQVIESGQLLVPYGYNSSSGCRYTDKDRTITHRITCKKIAGSEVKYNFLCLVTKADGSFKIEPPFDLVDVEDIRTGDRLSVALDELDFSVSEV